jgi:hypothetical protein
VNNKYVIIRTDAGELPVTFPMALAHKELESIKPEIISAGYWFVVDGEVQVFGPSVSLNLPSRPKDAHLIQRFLGLPLKDKVQEIGRAHV